MSPSPSRRDGSTPVISREHTARCFDPTRSPVLVVEPGTEVTFETDDRAYQKLYEGASLSTFLPGEFNLVTGPVFVEGAEPGDSLRIDILDIRIDRAWAVWMPGFGPLGDRNDRLEVRALAVEGDRVRLGPTLSVPLEPMIGCIGLAPSTGTASTLEPAYPFGGNMDLRELSPGATLFLPVQVPGALLSIGDLHAAMGTGEGTSLGLESSGAATVRIGLEKQLSLASPRIRLPGRTICVAVLDEGGTLENAYSLAMQRAFDHLVTVAGLDRFEAYAYCCARVELRLGGPASAMILAVIPDP